MFDGYTSDCEDGVITQQEIQVAQGYRQLIRAENTENDEDQASFGEDYDSEDRSSYHTDNEEKRFDRSCSCRAWDLSGIPCIHAVCAIFDRKKDPADYVHHCYSKEMYELTYSQALEPINGGLLWPRTQFEDIGAPIPRRMTGRPKKRRNREETEPRHSKTKMSRKGGTITCSMCKQSGHNKRFCPRKIN